LATEFGDRIFGPAVKFWMAPFVVVYASNVGFGLSELIEAVLILELPRLDASASRPAEPPSP
jgi:hypothetical protein